jgi:hypothetical protein
MDSTPTWRGELDHLWREWRGCEIARVAPTTQCDRWLVRLGVHRRDHRRLHTACRPTQEAACSTCVIWWTHHADAIAAELPRMVLALIGRRREYPKCNPHVEGCP